MTGIIRLQHYNTKRHSAPHSKPSSRPLGLEYNAKILVALPLKPKAAYWLTQVENEVEVYPLAIPTQAGTAALKLLCLQVAQAAPILLVAACHVMTKTTAKFTTWPSQPGWKQLLCSCCGSQWRGCCLWLPALVLPGNRVRHAEIGISSTCKPESFGNPSPVEPR